MKTLDFVVTPEWIKSNGACSDGAKWGIDTVGEGLSLRDLLPRFERADWMLWTLRKAEALKKVQYVELAAICAQTVLHIYEKRYPKDERPRKAIESAIAYAIEPTEANRKKAYAAYAADAADAAAYAYAAYVDAAYVDAADAAADAAAIAAADAADAAAYAYAADAADASYAADAAYAAANAAAYAADAAAYAASYAAYASYAAAYAASYAVRKEHHKKMCDLLLEKIQSWDRKNTEGV